jgi:predicted metal-dependent peptidase
MQRAVQIILQKEGFQNTDIRKSENYMMLQAMPMAWRKRILDTTSISYSIRASELHEQCLTINNVKNLNETYLTLYIAENEIICMKTTDIKDRMTILRCTVLVCLCIYKKEIYVSQNTVVFMVFNMLG